VLLEEEEPRGRRFGSDVELMIVYGAAILYYGFRTPVRALPISRYLEMPRETVLGARKSAKALGIGVPPNLSAEADRSKGRILWLGRHPF
jgi:hypothetical protein